MNIEKMIKSYGDNANWLTYTPEQYQRYMEVHDELERRILSRFQELEARAKEADRFEAENKRLKEAQKLVDALILQRNSGINLEEGGLIYNFLDEYEYRLKEETCEK